MTAAGQLALLPAPAPPRPWAKRGEFRAWLREERTAHEALIDAYASGDPGLIEQARRAHRESVARMPPCAARRRR